jgi:hypothetical protein
MDNMRRHAQLTICGVLMSGGLAWIIQKGWGQAVIPGGVAIVVGLIGTVWTVRSKPPAHRRIALERVIREGKRMLATDFDGNLWSDWTDGARAVLAEHVGQPEAHEFIALRNRDDSTLRGMAVVRVVYLETLL